MDARPAAAEAPPSLREFAYHLHEARYRALRVFVLVFGAFLIGAALLRPSYRATATLAVLPAPEYTVRGAAGSHDLNASALALDQIMKAETAILDSDDLHGATLRKLGPASLYPEIYLPDRSSLVLRLLHGVLRTLAAPWHVTPADPIAARDARGLRQFESDCLVLPTRDANVITVSLDNRDPVLAASGVNTLLGLYAGRRTRIYDDPQVEIVRKAVLVSAAKAAAADQALADYKRREGLSDSAQQRALLLHRLDQAQAGMADAASVLSEQQARVESLTQQLRAEPPSVAIFREQDPDTRLQSVNASLQDMQAKLAAARLRFLDTSHVVTALNAQIAAEKAEAARLGHDPAASVVRQGRNPNLESLRLDRARAGAELAAAQARLAAERTQAQDTQAALDRLDAAETGLLALQRDAQAAGDSFASASRIFADRHLSESEDLLRLANVRVIQPAIVPQIPRPLRLLVIGAGFVLAAFAALVRVIARFVLHPVFLTGEGLELATGLPVLAVFTRPDKKRETEEVLF
jgi:uncharacterized protein involved in exopolysaccharide biosynthesis